MKQLFDTPHISLRALEPEDLELLYTIENDTSMWHVASTTAPYSRFALKQHIADCNNDIFASKQLRLVIELKKDGKRKAIGLIDLFNFSPIDKKAETGIAVLSDFRKKGYAAEALRLLERYAKENLGMRMLYATVATASNKESAHLFLNSGYKMVATLPQWHYSKGKYEDVTLLCKFFSE